MQQDKPTAIPVRSADDLFGIIWETGWNACIRAFLVLLFGGIALSIVGGIFEEMIPSRPPFFNESSIKHPATAGTSVNGTPQLETDSSAQTESADTPADRLSKHDSPAEPHFPQFHHIDWTPLTKNHFLIVAGIFFSVGMWNRLRYGPPDESGAAPSRQQRIISNVSENWFKMVVGNAFGAMISAIMVVWVQQFSWPQLLWHWIFHNVLSTFQPLAETILGSGTSGALAQWWNWYGNNQLQFSFWFFYVAAICDDLGFPNFKTLGRWLGRRWRKHRQAAAQPISVSGKVN